ncbi:MAG: PD40 domain-containing protein [Piscinibacter sp.]|nr:PD40 domain-containing protein [Piscinibacter sp.]
MKNQSTWRQRTPALALIALAAIIAGCSGSGSGETTVTVNGDVPIAYVKRSTAMSINPTDGTPSAPGGDLMIREKSSPSAPEHNITSAITQGTGDASDPEVSYDGKKIVFALRCPTSNTSTIEGAPACTGRWNVWEYDMTTGGFAGGTLRRITSSTQFDDVDPAYMPSGRGFVFASNRQTTTRTVQGGRTILALDEYEREQVLNLHTMDKDGGAITQISANQSHDRNPVVRPNGDIMFSRWEHVGMRNRFAIFRVKPDGTDMFVLYGAHSPGNSFLHPRDMDPKGKYAGFVASDLMALSRTQEGGSLMFIDAENYSEQNTPANKSVAAVGGQTEVTPEPLNQNRGLSTFGRVTTPYPLWDGTDRVLVAYRPCQVTRDGVVIPCANLTDEERARLADGTRTRAEVAADTVQDNAPAAYGIYMYNPVNQTWLNVAAPPPGFMFTDPIALQARDEPNATEPTSVDSMLAAQNLGLLEVRSIYDTDGLQRMGEPVIAAADLPAGCTTAIAQRSPTEAADTRTSVADLVRMKDPADAAYHCSPARFVRAIRAVAPQAGMSGMREAIGETDFEPQQILGYAPIEPDGSFRLKVPADTPLALVITDDQGRGLQTHLNWIQVRPGERRTCDGCHSPRRGASLNSGATVNALPAALNPALASLHQSGQTMANLRTNQDQTLMNLKPDMVFSDVWANTAMAGVTARASIELKYTGNTNPADDLQTLVPTNGLINYPMHIQPIWSRARGTGGSQTCTNCHTDTAALSLLGTTSGTGRIVSYEELVLGDPLIDDATGLPVTRLEEGVPMIVRGAALVETDAGNAQGLARASRLIEILFGQTLKSGAEARETHPTPTTLDHSTLLNKAEKRLVTEWVDLGGQYYNDLTAGGSGVQLNTLSEQAFLTNVYPILQADCAGCHQPVGSSGAAQTASSFQRNRFVLTGSEKGDFNVTLSMISDTCNAPSNALLMRPSTAPHPAGATGQTTPPLPAGSANYNTIQSWIASGCP